MEKQTDQIDTKNDVQLSQNYLPFSCSIQEAIFGLHFKISTLNEVFRKKNHQVSEIMKWSQVCPKNHPPPFDQEIFKICDILLSYQIVFCPPPSKFSEKLKFFFHRKIYLFPPWADQAFQSWIVFHREFVSAILIGKLQYSHFVSPSIRFKKATNELL